MRNLKKILSVLLVVAMIATTMVVPAFAASYTYESQAKALNTVGLFNGVSTTTFDPDLGSSVTREQGIAIVVRLLGKAADAAKLTAADADAALAAFSDAKEIDASLKNSVAYAVKNKLVQGTSNTTIDPKGAMVGNDLTTILLRNLGYTVDAAAYKTATATLAEKGGLTADQVAKFATKELIRDDLVGIAYGSLQAKDSKGTKIIDKLIADKVVDQAKAEAVGIIEKVTAATSMTVKGTGRDTITVTFNGTVDTSKVKLAVKRGSTAITTTTKFADDKKSATVVGASKFSEGEYTVVASGVTDKDLTGTATYEDERVDKISFTSDKAVIVPAEGDAENMSVYVYFKLENQYGEDITDSYTTYSGDIEWNTSYDGIDEKDGKYGKLKITSDDDEFNFGDSVPMSVVYNDEEHVVTASTVLSVATKAGVGSIEVSKLYNDMDKKLDLNSTYTSFYLLFDLKDQYGNKINANTDDINFVRDDLTVSTTNSSVIKFTDDEDNEYNFQKLVVNGEDVIALPLEDMGTDAQAGTASVTVVSKTTGKMAQYAVEVGQGTYAASFSMSKPDVAVAGEKIIIPFTAFDADGNAVTDVDDLNCDNEDYKVDLSASGLKGKVGDTDNYFKFEENPTTNKAQLVLNTEKLSLGEDDTVTLTATTGKTFKTSSINLKFKAPKYPETISGISSSYYKKIAQGAFAELKYDKITVQDNYDRAISSGELRYQLISELGIQPTTTLKADGSIDKYQGDTIYSDGAYRVAISSSSPNVQVIGAYGDNKGTATTTDDVYYIGKDTEKVWFYGATEGTATITIKMEKKQSDGSWKEVADSDYDFTMTTVDRDDIKSIAVGAIAESYDYPYYGSNNDNLNTYKVAKDFGNTFSVDGVLADGSKVWLSKEIVPNTTDGIVSVYSTTTSYKSNFAALQNDKAVSKCVYNAIINQKFAIGTKLNEDEDEKTTVPFSVTVSSKYLKNADNVSSSFVVNSADPTITTLTLVYNQFAQLSSDGGYIEINDEDVKTIYNSAYASTGDKFDLTIKKIVADAVKAVDQYGKEQDKEFFTFAKGDVYSIPTSDDSTLETLLAADPVNADIVGQQIEVTVISNNGAVSKTFTISVK